jgi:hypothetical protein
MALAGVLAALAAVTIAPGTAAAAVSCDYTSGSGELEVGVTDGTPSVFVSRATSPANEVLVDTDDDPGNGTVACGGGTPTLLNPSEVSVDESGSSQGTTLFLDFERGRLEPGLGAEAGPGSAPQRKARASSAASTSAHSPPADPGSR